MTEENNDNGAVEIEDPKAVLDALERAKKDAKKFREELEALQAEYDGLKSEIATLDTWKNRTKELLIKGSLGSNAERLMKFLDHESITLGDDGDIQGLDEAINKVKSDLPELFDPKRQVGGAADAFEQNPPKQELKGTDAQVARLFNR